MANLPAPPYSNETGKTSAGVNWKVGAGNGRHVTGITIHHWGSTQGLDFDGIVNFLCSPRPGNPTSAHYVVQGKDAHGVVKPRVACIVDPDNIAYACGTWPANLSQISIECRPECSPEDRETVAQLIARLRNVYGNLPLFGHQHWVPDQCPGSNWMASLGWLSSRAATILAGTPAPAPRPAPTPVPAKPTIHVANIRPGYSNADVTAYNKLLWAAQGPVYKQRMQKAWYSGSANRYDAASEQVTFDTYAYRHQVDPKNWGPPPSRPVWPGQQLIRFLGGNPA